MRETLHREHFSIDGVVEMSRPGFASSATFAQLISHTASNSALVSG